MKQTTINENKNGLIPFSGNKGLLTNMEKTYGRNLVRNGGFQGEGCTDFIDTDGDGLADGFISPNNSEMGLVNIGGSLFQRIVSDGVDPFRFTMSFNELGGKLLLVRYKYRSNISLSLILGSTGTSIPLTASEENVKVVEGEFVVDGVDSVIFFMRKGSPTAGDWFEISEIELRVVQIADESGLSNNSTVYGSPTESYLGSLKALDFGTNTDKYLQSLKTIEGTIEYLIAYKNSLGIKVNNSQDITTDNLGSVVDNKLLIGKNGANYFSGLVATTFASIQTMTDAEKLVEVNKLLFLAKNIGVWKGVGADETAKRICDLEDTNFIGTLYTVDGAYPSASTKATDTDDFRYYDEVANLIYAPLPITLKDSMITDLDVSGNKLIGITPTRQFELGLDKLMFNTQKIQSGGIAVSLDGSKTAIASTGDVITMNLVNPSTGRVLGYTRTVNGSNYDHKFYVDYNLVDEFTSADLFANSPECDIPLDVSGSQLTISPSNYILDDLIVDGKTYVKNQFRAFYLADELVDDLNPKLLIAPVQGFSNQIIYSVDSDGIPIDLQPLAEANKSIKTIITYED